MNPSKESQETASAPVEVNSVEPKYFLKSKTILGVLILLLAVAQYLGVDTMKMSAEARNLLATASGILIILGIRTADRPLTFRTKPSDKSPLWLIGVLGMSCMACLCVTSCSSFTGSAAKVGDALETTPDGCLLVKKEFKNGTIGKAGYCLDGRYVVQWQTPDLAGKQVWVRAVYRKHGGAYELFYWSGNVWLEYSEKNGLVIGTPPSEQGEPVRVDATK